ncbi:MAG: hypothetical protein PWP23_3003 [Candidatus Sumerlaeota bacterium]|nr:hypothetical protein [Candidatus Sumerlaeota bacterium]
MTPHHPRRRPPARFNRLALYLASFWISFVLFLNNQPGSAFKTPRIKLLPHSDKFAHFLFYAIMGALIWRATIPQPGEPRRAPVRHPLLFVFLIPCLVGLIDEINQVFVPGRSADVADWMTDAAGALTVIVLGWMLSRRKNSREFS